jgi:hypothetical protein
MLVGTAYRTSIKGLTVWDFSHYPAIQWKNSMSILATSSPFFQGQEMKGCELAL